MPKTHTEISNDSIEFANSFLTAYNHTIQKYYVDEGLIDASAVSTILPLFGKELGMNASIAVFSAASDYLLCFVRPFEEKLAKLVVVSDDPNFDKLWTERTPNHIRHKTMLKLLDLSEEPIFSEIWIPGGEDFMNFDGAYIKSQGDAQGYSRGNQDMIELLKVPNPRLIKAVDTKPFLNKSSDPFDVFLSYSHEETTIMDRIYDTLTTAGFRVWSDKNLEPGTSSWDSAIEKAIETSSCFTVVLSPSAKASENVRQECAYAKEHKKKIFTVLAKGDQRASVPLGLIISQWVDIREEIKYEPEMKKLAESIRKYIGNSGKDLS